MFPLMIDTLDISISEELEDSRIESWHRSFKRGIDITKRLGGLDSDMFDGDCPARERWRGWIGFAGGSHGLGLHDAD
jgi:hypothetical protein